MDLRRIFLLTEYLKLEIPIKKLLEFLDSPIKNSVIYYPSIEEILNKTKNKMELTTDFTDFDENQLKPGETRIVKSVFSSYRA